MLALVNRILDWFKSLFWKEEMELTLVGLQCSGKTTFVNVIAVSILIEIDVLLNILLQRTFLWCALLIGPSFWNLLRHLVLA